MVKLIHASDVHLGITYAGIGKNHREIARELKQAAFDAFETVVNKAIEEEVDALVLSGDLLDSQRTFIKEKLFLQQQLNRLAPFGIPVILALGNHDAGTPYVSGEHIYTFGNTVETIELETKMGNGWPLVDLVMIFLLSLNEKYKSILSRVRTVMFMLGFYMVR